MFLQKKKIFGLVFFVINKIPHMKTILTNLGIGRIISYAHKTGLLSYDHYADEYWNELDMVQKYINKHATDNEDKIWQIDLLSRFAEYIPFQKCLVIGCGNGWVERQLYDLKIGLNFDAFDISKKYLKEAKGKKENRPIRYFKDDLNNLEKLPLNHYDAIFNVGALHHGFRLSKTLWYLNRSMKSNGLMFNFDYVGPALNNYSNDHVKLLTQINKQLPKRFQTTRKFTTTKEDIAFGDSTEAVNSDLVRPIFERFFDIIYQRDLNGGIGYPLLVVNTKEFHKNDDDVKYNLAKILEYDKKFTIEHKIPVLFWYGVGKPKTKESISYSEFLPD